MIEQIVTEYFEAWNKALDTNNPDYIRQKMSKKFTGFWCHSALDVPQKYDYNYDLNAVLEQYLNMNAQKSFEIESITERTNDMLVIGTETNTVNGIEYPAKAIFVWRQENNQWKLLREYIELIN